MSGDESFLSRWSRRKREGEGASAAAARPAPAAPAESGERAGSGEPDPDLSHLPPVDLIDAMTDVRGFLARGVPAALTQAALRRAWAADPAIRDFVGLSENAWDFTAPGGVPGFGPMTPEAAQSLTAGLGDPLRFDLPERDSASSETPAGTAGEAADNGDDHGIVNAERQAGDEPFDAGAEAAMEDRVSPPAGQSADIAEDLGEDRLRRRHGGALPV